MSISSKDLCKALAVQRILLGHLGLGSEMFDSYEQIVFVSAEKMKDEATVVTKEKTKPIAAPPTTKPNKGVKLCYYCNKHGHNQIKCDDIIKASIKKKQVAQFVKNR